MTVPLYIREEEDEKYSVALPRAESPVMEIINKTMYYIISIIDGGKSVKDIYDNLIDKYGEDHSNQIENDLSKSFMLLWGKGILNWKENKYPKMEELMFNIDDETVLQVAFDEDIRDIKKYVSEIEDDEKYIKYKNIFEVREEMSASYVRNTIFNMNVVYFIAKKKEEIVGVFSLRVPAGTKSTSLDVDFVFLQKKQFKDILKAIKTIANKFVIIKATKIKFSILEEDVAIINFLTEMNFKLEGTLEKEIDLKNIKIYSDFI